MKLTSAILFVVLVFGAFSQDVFEAARTGNLDRLKELQKMNVDTLESVNSNGFTPLIIATYRNQEKCVNHLIMEGVNLDSNSPEGPALLGACYKGNVSIISLLLENGAETNICGANGTTPLIFAVQRGDLEIVKLLLDYGAIVSKQCENGHTAIDYAKKLNNDKIVALLNSAKD